METSAAKELEAHLVDHLVACRPWYSWWNSIKQSPVSFTTAAAMVGLLFVACIVGLILLTNSTFPTMSGSKYFAMGLTLPAAIWLSDLFLPPTVFLLGKGARHHAAKQWITSFVFVIVVLGVVIGVVGGGLITELVKPYVLGQG